MMLLKLFFSCLLTLATAWSEPLPKTASESLTGHVVMLPDLLKGHPSVIVVGFSKNSQNAVKEWDTRVRKQLGEAFPLYQIAVLEDAPRLVRPMIIHAMKGSIPLARQDYFLVVVKGEAELKKAAEFAAADEAYVFLLDGTSEIVWRTHGAVSEAQLTVLAEQAKKLR